MSDKVALAIRPTLAGRPHPLRVGVAVARQASVVATARLISAIDVLAMTEGVHLQNIYRVVDRRAPAPAALFRLYQNIAGLRGDLPARRRAAPLPDTFPWLSLRPEDHSLSGRDGDTISRDDLDVLVWLGEPPAGGDCSRLARHGVLSLCFGDPDHQRRQPPYFWEAYTGEPTQTLAVQLHRLTFDQAVLLDRIVTGTQRTFPFTDNAADCLAGVGAVLVRSLKRLSEREPGDLGPAYPVRRAGPSPGNRETAVAFLRHARISISERVKSFRKWLAWEIFIRSGQERFVDRQEKFEFDGFRPVESPDGHYYADPFVVDRNGRSFLFFEDFVVAADRARLAMMEISPTGVSVPSVIVERPYHLSYLFVFTWKGDDFMIPESGVDRTVQLLRCRRFPDEWQLERHLCEGVSLLDTTPFHLDGVWYFFTFTAEAPHELHLFHAQAIDGPWTPHPANPICSDVRRARSAGALFYRGGKLIRPAQDGSVRYGHALVLNEVLRLTPAEYEEIPVEIIEPAACGGLLGVHTINRSSQYEVIDGLRLMRR